MMMFIQGVTLYSAAAAGKLTNVGVYVGRLVSVFVNVAVVVAAGVTV